MRVLVVSPHAPSKSHVHGGATRLHRIYSGLIARGNDVTVVAPFTREESANVELLEDEGFTIRPYLRPSGRLRELLGTLLRRPALLGLAARASGKELVTAVFWVHLRQLVREALTDADYDVVVIEHSFAARWREEIETDLPVLLVVHELESPQLLAKAVRLGGARGFARYLDGGRTLRSEKRCTPLFDGVVLMSEVERMRLSQIVGEGLMPQSYVVGNGADLEPLSAVGPDPDEQRVLFTGTLAYPPNVVAAEWIARKVWPHVLAAEPAARLDIVGAGPSRATLALGQLEGIEVHGDVPSMLPWFDRASVCTLPMLEGGGTRLKLIDAFAASRAVVATTNGATGVDCSHGRELLIADSPEDFARAILRLLGDREQRERLGRHGRALAERSYGWDRLAGEFDDVLGEVVGRRSVTPIKVVVSDADV